MDIETFAAFISRLPLLREQAYLDPGSGSFLLQLLLAGLVGVGFAIKMSWKKIKAFFNRSAADADSEDTDDSGQDS